ncbi:MAG TPA: ABC transporter permease [Candidatus Korarchaeota archaeon]|nr:ABC transporter permease [Candidatus Korarchaeota archaeon]
MKRIISLLRRYVRPLSESIVSVLIGVFIGSIIILLAGYSPLVFYEALFSGSFKHTRAFLDTLSYMIPLTMTALSFAVAARASVFNIGAEGQMYMGALIANIIGTYVRLPRLIHPLVAVIAAFLAGGFWGWLAGILKTKRKVNEVVSTIMLNWIAFYIVNYVSTYHLFDPAAPYKTTYVLESSRFPPLVKGTSLTADFILALIIAIVVFFLVWKTSLGYEIRAVGLNPTAAEYGGVNPERIASIAMFIAGGCGGLAGAFLVLGRFGFITTTLTNILNWGFDGIAVSLVGRNHPIGIIFSSFFFAILNSGALEVQVETSKGGQIGVPYELVLAVMGIIVIAISVPGLLDLIRARMRRGEEVERVALA